MPFLKYDSEKPLMSLLPARAITAVAHVMTYGAKKYAPNNWKKVEDRGRYEDALMRHLFAYLDGETHDRESTIHHLAHVACNALFLLEATLQGYGRRRTHVPDEVLLGDAEPLLLVRKKERSIGDVIGEQVVGAPFDEALPPISTTKHKHLRDLRAGDTFRMHGAEYTVDFFRATPNGEPDDVTAHVLNDQGVDFELDANYLVELVSSSDDGADDPAAL